MLEAHRIECRRGSDLALLAGWAAEWAARQERLSSSPAAAYEHLVPTTKQAGSLELTAMEFRSVLIELTHALGGKVDLS